MKMHQILIISSLLLSFTVIAGVKLDILSWTKEETSEDQISYISPEKKVSLSIGKLKDPTEWDTENLEEEILEMQKSRAEIISFFGMSEYHIGHFEYDDSDEQFFVLTLAGSYQDIDDETVYFKEINIRYGHIGTQIKMNGPDYDQLQDFDLSDILKNEKMKLIEELKGYEINESR